MSLNTKTTKISFLEVKQNTKKSQTLHKEKHKQAHEWTLGNLKILSYSKLTAACKVSTNVTFQFHFPAVVLKSLSTAPCLPVIIFPILYSHSYFNFAGWGSFWKAVKSSFSGGITASRPIVERPDSMPPDHEIHKYFLSFSLPYMLRF